MAITSASPGIALVRTTSLPTLSTAVTSTTLTLMGWFQIPNDSFWSFFALCSDDSLFTSPYYFLGQHTGDHKLYIETFDGVTTTDYLGVTLPNAAWFHVAWVINGTSQRVYLSLVDRSRDADLVIDVTTVLFPSSPGFNHLFAYVDFIGGATMTGSQVRIWQRALTQAEIRTERNSPQFVLSSGIYLSSPLATSGNFLNDTSPNGNNWTQDASGNGAASTATEPIPNQVASWAATIPSLVASDYTVTMDTATFSNALVMWWKYTGIDPEVEIGFLAWSDPAFNFKPRVSIWQGVDLNNLTKFPNAITQTLQTQAPVVAAITDGQTLYFKVDQGGAGTPLGTSLLISGKTAPRSTVASGSILINDDFSGFNAITMSPAGTVLRYLRLPAGEMGVVLSNGSILLEYNASLPSVSALYKPDFTLLTYEMGAGQLYALTSDRQHTFYVSRSSMAYPTADVALVTTINDRGIIGGTTWTLPANSTNMSCLGVNQTGTILYYSTFTAGLPIHRYDLVNNVALADLVAGIANYAPIKDILVLSDGTLLVGYFNGMTNDSFVKHYSAAGATLATYNFGTDRVNHLAMANDDPNSFWVWIYPGGGHNTARFKNIKVSDGSTLSTFDIDTFEQGSSQITPYASSSPIRFGPSFSCPLMITANAQAGIVIDPPVKQWGIHRLDIRPRQEQRG